jgi:hypothetical protein
MRNREEILEGCYSKEVKIQNKVMYHKQVEPLKLNLAILETLLDIREQNEKR